MAVDVAQAISAALSKLGTPYQWGAEGPNAFDCSGLLVWAFHKVGVNLPRTSQAMARYGTPVALKDVRPGDLVTSNWGSGPSSHVGLYIGNGKIVHAPRPGKGVVVANLDANYRSHVDAVRRVPGAAAAGAAPAGLDDVLGDLGSGLSGVLDWVGVINKPIMDIATGILSVGKLAEFLLKLALPSTWVRIQCGLLGAVLLFLGLVFMVAETRGAGA